MYEEEPGGELSLRMPQRLVSGDDNEQRTYTLYFHGMNDSCQRIVWDAATCCGTLHSQHDEPVTSFSRSPFLFFSSRVACLVVLPIGPFMCLQVNFLSSLSPSTCVEAQQNA